MSRIKTYPYADFEDKIVEVEIGNRNAMLVYVVEEVNGVFVIDKNALFEVFDRNNALVFVRENGTTVTREFADLEPELQPLVDDAQLAFDEGFVLIENEDNRYAEFTAQDLNL